MSCCQDKTKAAGSLPALPEPPIQTAQAPAPAKISLSELWPDVEQAIPQYRRMYVEGCLCRTAFAGGGLCPGHLAGLSVQGHALVAGLGVGAASYGMFCGIRVLKNTWDAISHLNRVLQDTKAKRENLQLQERGKPPLAKLRALETLERRLRASRQNQYAQWFIAGVLQTVVSAAYVAVLVGAQLGLSFCHQPWLMSLVPSLLAVYAVLLAVKYGLSYVADRQIFKRLPSATKDYAQAGKDYLLARKAASGRTALAWASVAATSLLGASVSAGFWVFPHAWAVIFAATLGAAGWSMWENSRSRYAPHTPTGPRIQFECLANEPQRAKIYDILNQQDEVVQKAVNQLTEHQHARHKLYMYYERLFQVQCGPESFLLLATSVQQGRGQAMPNGADIKQNYAQIQINAALDYCKLERQLPSYNVQEHTLPTLIERLEKLQEDCSTEHFNSNDFKKNWLHTRLILLQYVGALGEAVPAELIKDNPEYFWGFNEQTKTELAFLPVNNIYVHPDKVDDFSTAMVKFVDHAFVHAFLNPRRLAGQIDYLLDWEIDTITRRHDASVEASPAVLAQTCCQS